MKKLLLTVLLASMHMTAFCQLNSDSLRSKSDSTIYSFYEFQVKEFIKAKIDADACDSVLVLKNKIIQTQNEQKIELQRQVDSWIEQNKIEIKKQKRLKWGIGTVGAVIAGLTIYAIVRK